MLAGQILEHTKNVAAELEQRFPDDPKGELDCWVATAHQREAMVVEIYNALNLHRRVPDQDGREAGAVKLVREVIGSIWAQETSHATLMQSLRKLDDPRWQVEGAQGSVEGLITAWATARGVLGSIARAGTAVARFFKAAPPFTEHLQAEPLLGFLRLSEELELTASNGYSRILELLSKLDEKRESSGYGLIPEYEFATTHAEERFHHATFGLMQRWVKRNERELAALDIDEAVAAIETLAHQHLTVKKLKQPRRGLTDTTAKFLEALPDDTLVSEGGLGDVFRRYGVELRVTEPPREG